MEKILVKNATIIDSGTRREADILINDGVIEKIDSSIGLSPSTRLVQADGMYVLPGVIDTHVHFREPGLTHKATFASESLAAVAGGVTTVVDMPNNIPATTTIEAFEDKCATARETSAVNYSFMVGATAQNIDEIKKIDVKRVAAVKLFMGSSTGNMALKEDDRLEELFKESPVMIATHCEDDAIITANMEKAREKYGEDIPAFMHEIIRDEKACFNSSREAVEMARKTGARLHLLHISTERELELIQNTEFDSHKMITGEACSHHLFFCDEDYKRLGNVIKVNPSVKKASDRDALWEAVVSGRIDTIATDHAPHTWEEKSRSYLSCPSGGPMIQHSLLAVLDEVAHGRLTMETAVERMCHTPARLFQMKNRGYIKEGYYADMTMVELNSPWRVHKENLLYKCGWSAFEDRMFSSRVRMTMVGGKLAYSNGKAMRSGGAREIEFDR